ncbi:MAG: LysR family transcriptional regulator, partial [Rhodospirillales bacterium]|nr:LysR family transcriptional regulator [Rhodospirillales bacterium]
MFEKRSDLNKLLVVAETGQILSAADKLAITQPALSRIVSKLEEQFRGRLFERIPTGVRLTELGSIVT